MILPILLASLSLPVNNFWYNGTGLNTQMYSADNAISFRFSLAGMNDSNMHLANAEINYVYGIKINFNDKEQLDSYTIVYKGPDAQRADFFDGSCDFTLSFIEKITNERYNQSTLIYQTTFERNISIGRVLTFNDGTLNDTFQTDYKLTAVNDLSIYGSLIGRVNSVSPGNHSMSKQVSLNNFDGARQSLDLEITMRWDTSSKNYFNLIESNFVIQTTSETYQEGYQQGFNQGYQQGVSDGNSSFLDWLREIMKGCADILRIEILPHFKLSYLIGMFIIIPTVSWVLNWFR